MEGFLQQEGLGEEVLEERRVQAAMSGQEIMHLALEPLQPHPEVCTPSVGETRDQVPEQADALFTPSMGRLCEANGVALISSA